MTSMHMVLYFDLLDTISKSSNGPNNISGDGAIILHKDLMLDLQKQVSVIDIFLFLFTRESD